MIVGNALFADCGGALVPKTDSFDSGLSKDVHRELDSCLCRIFGSDLRVVKRSRSRLGRKRVVSLVACRKFHQS
jgi:hypothetical protein